MEASGKRRGIIGILLVIVGAIFLLDNLGFDIDLPWYLFRWPMILIAIGVVNLLTGNPRPAFIFFALGGLFYLQLFDIIHFRDFWPLILIIIGLSFIFRRKTVVSSSSETSLDVFDEVAIFGGGNKKFVSKNLKGGKISCVFGGLEIDLRDSTPEDGATIEIFCMFGGVELLVPEDWKINMAATAIFGGFSDDRAKVTTDTIATVHVKGFVMFGGGELKN